MIQQSGLTLAYLGDSYYELEIRKHLIQKGLTKVNDLHKSAIRFTSATGQATVVRSLMESFLTEEEIEVYKRGRNAPPVRNPKNVDLPVYLASTGFECLIGFLYLENRFDRLSEIIQKSIQTIEELQVKP